MGFKYIALQTGPEALYNHSAGALLIFVGSWLCWEALVISRDAWWRDPINAAKFAQKFRVSQSWVSIIENHPATISEMIGDQSKAQGAVAMAICVPACMLALAGGFMVNQAWPVHEDEDPLFAHLTNAVRSVLMPVGFLMVLFTPIISLDKYEYGVDNKGMPYKSKVRRSETEEQWHMQHHNVHAAGFVSAVVLGLLWEVAFLIADLRWYFSAAAASSSLLWPKPAHFVWCVLAFLRGVALVLQALSLKSFVMIMSEAVTLKDPRLLNYQKWMCEYSSLVLGGMVMMYDAASVLTFAGHGPRSLQDWPSLIMVGLMLLETVRFTKGFFGLGGVRWAGVAALYDLNKVDFEGLLHYIFAVRCSPPLLLAVKQKSKAELLGIDIAQAGDKDEFTVLWHDLGAGLPKVQALVVCPGLVERVEAITFDELSDDDLLIYHEDLARTLRQLPSAEVMLVPYGRKIYKIGRRMPLAVLLLGDYIGDLLEVRKGVTGAQPQLPDTWARTAGCGANLGIARPGLRINSEPYWPWRTKLWETQGYEDVARDVTAAVRARLPLATLGSWRQDLMSQLESGADLRPLYQVLKTELAPLEEYEVQIRGLVGGPPQLVAVTLKANLEKAQASALWCEGREVAIMPDANGAQGKVYHKLV